MHRRRRTVAALLASACAVVAAAGGARVAAADPKCQRAVELRLAPVPNVQMAVWIEDRATGAVVDTIYVTRSTGLLGLGNRPGHPRLRGDYRFPYGAREMVLPVWAWRRGKTYPRVVMGGAAGFEDNDTIGDHFQASSPEAFYCSPLGGVHRPVGGVDTVSCASQFFGSKGRYADAADGGSRYPPRADLTTFLADHDSEDARRFSSDNDLAAVSGATPPGGAELAPPLRWTPESTTPDGQYVARVEVSLEADFDASWPACTSADPGCAHPTRLDDKNDLQGYGHEILGQPSLVWSVPFTLDGTTRVATTADYEGYGSWDGSSGALAPPDATIRRDTPGSGAGRLLAIRDGDGAWRVKVTSLGCDAAACLSPAPPSALHLSPSDTTVRVRFAAPGGLVRPARYDVRYAPGTALDDATFENGIPADGTPAPAGPGETQQLEVTGLKADTLYTVGVRAVAGCGKTSPAVLAQVSTGAARFATLHGCFVATAAYGSPLAGEVAALRRLRDQRLLPSAIGRLAVATYYALSPSLAAAIAGDVRLRAAARAALAPLVVLARHVTW